MTATATLERTQAPAQVTIPASQTLMVGDVRVEVNYLRETNLPVTEQEIRAYIERGNLQNVNTVVAGLRLDVDGEDVEITYDLAPVPFDRIRRITGYLVGTMDRWNDAKTSEEHDRVKHSVPVA